jgi:hypothetical protein
VFGLKFTIFIGKRGYTYEAETPEDVLALFQVMQKRHDEADADGKSLCGGEMSPEAFEKLQSRKDLPGSISYD